MNPVVHFEMPFDNQVRMAKFYESVLGWQLRMLGEDMGDYVLATTAESNESGPINPGAINGGFYPRNPDAQYPSVVIGVGDIRQSAKGVIAAGGKVLGEPMEIPGVGQYVSYHRYRGQPLEHASAQSAQIACAKERRTSW